MMILICLAPDLQEQIRHDIVDEVCCVQRIKGITRYSTYLRIVGPSGTCDSRQADTDHELALPCAGHSGEIVILAND